MSDWASDLVYTGSTEAEWSVIGSMLIDDRTVAQAVGALREEDFGDSTCRNTFGAIRCMFLAGRKIDPVLVKEELKAGGEWVNWAKQVMDLTPTAANVGEYVKIVREQSVRRQVRAAAAALSEAAATAGMEELTRQAMSIPGLLTDSGRGRTVTASELMTSAYQRATSKTVREYLPWGIPSADRALYIEPGDLVLLGGYPSAGKTLLSIQMAIAQAGGRRVVYYTLETQPDKMGDRILSHISPVSLTAIKRSEVHGEDVGRMAAASARFVEHSPITFVHASHFSVADIAADALSKRAEVVYIDYVQLVEGEGRTDYARVSAVSRDLKMFAQTNRVTVVALAQLSRAEKVTNKGQVVRIPPDMSSLKESGQLEQDADAVFLLWRLRDEDNASERILKLGKNKEGRKFATVMAFDGPTQTMTDLEVSPKDYDPEKSVAGMYSAQGRAIKRMNRARVPEQKGFQEMQEDGEENPFEKGE